jgi:hypothetical protein
LIFLSKGRGAGFGVKGGEKEQSNARETTELAPLLNLRYLAPFAFKLAYTRRIDTFSARDMPSDAIYLISDSGELRRIEHELCASDDILQELVAKHPDVLAGDQIDPGAPAVVVI